VNKSTTYAGVVCLVVFLVACATGGRYEVDLMQAPEVYDEEYINPFTDDDPVDWSPYKGVLYATDRQPAADNDSQQSYLNKRGHLLRLGRAGIALGDNTLTWEEARRISLLKNRSEAYPLHVESVSEFGILDRSIDVLMPEDILDDDSRAAATEFAKLINDKLSISEVKDVYIYVHGYKVVFDNPILVAAELWHFLGYEGAFIAYAWPSTPSRLAYMADIETAHYSARNLRVLLTYLAEETQAEKIHIIGYSAGTRVVLTALGQLTLENKHLETDAIREKLRIGHVILTGSDHDRDIFGSYLDEGLLRICENLTLYMSVEDQALGVSRFIFSRNRLGQTAASGEWDPAVIQYLRENRELTIVDVSDAQSATAGNGHAYFRGSPWVSSDILMSLRYDLSPEDRGLVVDHERQLWTFPTDYVERLQTELKQRFQDDKPQLSSAVRQPEETSRGLGYGL
jgi:esterase/lipase superfamily enzyme